MYVKALSKYIKLIMMNTTRTKIALYAVPVALLLLPLIAMQFTTEVNWTFSDFLIGGILLFGTAGALDLVMRTVKSRRNRIILCVSVLLLLFLVWAELAVGIFGTPFAGS